MSLINANNVVTKRGSGGGGGEGHIMSSQPPLLIRSSSAKSGSSSTMPALIPSTSSSGGGSSLVKSSPAATTTAKTKVTPAPPVLDLTCCIGKTYRNLCHRKYLGVEEGMVRWGNIQTSTQAQILSKIQNQVIPYCDDLICKHHLKELSYIDPPEQVMAEKGPCKGYGIVHKNTVLTTRLGVLTYYNNIAGKNNEVLPGKFVCSTCVKVLHGPGAGATNIYQNVTKSDSSKKKTYPPASQLKSVKNSAKIVESSFRKILPNSPIVSPSSCVGQETHPIDKALQNGSVLNLKARQNPTEAFVGPFRLSGYAVEAKLDEDEKELVLQTGNSSGSNDDDDDEIEERDPLELTDEHEQYFENESEDAQPFNRLKRPYSDTTDNDTENLAKIRRKDNNDNQISKETPATSSNNRNSIDKVTFLNKPTLIRSPSVEEIELVTNPVTNNIPNGIIPIPVGPSNTNPNQNVSSSGTILPPPPPEQQFQTINRIFITAGVAPILVRHNLSNNTTTPGVELIKTKSIEKINQLVHSCINLLKKDNIEIDMESVLKQLK